MNAQELYEEMQYWAGIPYSDADGFDLSIDPRQVLSIALGELGGYTRVPENASPPDQVTLMLYPIAIYAQYSPPDTAQAMWFQFDSSVQSWYASGPNTPLDTFMQQEPAWEEFAP